jgi:hypothetical protein
MGQRVDPTETHRACRVCHRRRPIDEFYRSGSSPNARRGTCRTCMADAANRSARARAVPVRHPRYNARGEVWCNRCQQYLGAESFKRHPQRPHTYWSYCMPCTRIIDRERYARRTRDLDRAIAELERHNQRKRKRSAADFAARRRFLVESISLLRRRGLPKAEIVRLTDTSFGNLLKWERGERHRPTKAVCERFAIVVRETGDLPAGVPVARRRLPHPAMGELLARCLPKVQAIPVRDTWKYRRHA